MPDGVALAAAALGVDAQSWHAVTARTGNQRGHWIVRLRDGTSIFVKAPWDDASAAWLATEALVYQNVQGSFLPRLLAWDGSVLVLEDLSGELWPPAWTPEGIGAVLASLHELGEAPPPAGLPRLTDQRELLIERGWPAIQADPEPFLSLGLCGRNWLEAALPELRSATESAELDGEALVHLDIRSDNLCLRDGHALFVDWNQASIGNPRFDLAEWLPSLATEGGPVPEELMPEADAAPFAALLAGLWGARAGLPVPDELPNLRNMQRVQAAEALAWSARALGLPAPS